MEINEFQFSHLSSCYTLNVDVEKNKNEFVAHIKTCKQNINDHLKHNIFSLTLKNKIFDTFLTANNRLGALLSWG